MRAVLAILLALACGNKSGTPAAGGSGGSGTGAGVGTGGVGTGGVGTGGIGTGGVGTGGVGTGGIGTGGASGGAGGRGGAGGGTTPGPGDFGASCGSDANCDAGLVCYRPDLKRPTANNPGYCTYQPCSSLEGGVCPAPLSGTSASLCSPTNDTCVFDCANGATCPIGMQCLTIPTSPTIMRCAYPRIALEPMYGICQSGTECTSGTCHPNFHYCTQTCNGTGTCPVPPNGTATLQCTAPAGQKYCTLVCANGALCPNQLTCTTGFCMQ